MPELSTLADAWIRKTMFYVAAMSVDDVKMLGKKPRSDFSGTITVSELQWQGDSIVITGTVSIDQNARDPSANSSNPFDMPARLIGKIGDKKGKIYFRKVRASKASQTSP